MSPMPKSSAVRHASTTGEPVGAGSSHSFAKPVVRSFPEASGGVVCHASSSPSISPPLVSSEGSGASVPSPRELNRAIVKLEHDVEGLLSLIATSVQAFDTVNCATALNRLSKAATGPKSPLSVPRLGRDPRTRQLLARTASLLHHCDARQLANIINGLAKLSIRPDASFLTAFYVTVDQQLQHFNTLELCNTVHSLAKLRLHPGSRLLTRLLGHAQALLPEANAQTIANLYNALARLDEPCPSFLTALTQRARGELRGFSPQHLANSLNAMARLKHDPGKDFMHECMTVVLSRLSEFSPQELSCLINSLSKMAGPDCEADPDPDNTYAEAKLLPPQVVLSSLLEATTPLLPSSSARDLSCILNGIARLGYDPGDEYMALLSQRAIRVAPSFTTQGLATSLNALSRLPPGRAPPSLVRRLAQATHRLLILQAQKKAKDAFTPQGLSLVLLGLSKLGQPLPPPAPAHRTLARVPTPSPPSSASSSPSEEEGESLSFLDAWLACATPLLPSFSPQHHSSTLYAFVLLDKPPPKPFLSLLTCALQPVLPQCSPHQASLLLSCLPRLGHDPGPFFVHALLQHCPRPLNPQDLALTLGGLSALLHQPPPSFWPQALSLLRRHRPLSLLDVCPLLWALAVLDFPRDAWPVLQHASSLLPSLVAAQGGQVELEVAMQLYQVAMALAVTPGRGAEVMGGEKEWQTFRQAVAQAWGQHEERIPNLNTSPAQREVQATLAELGCRVKSEVAFGPYTLDLLALPLPPSSRSEGAVLLDEGLTLPPLAVEVDGETHFITDASGKRRPLGQTLLKRRAMWAYEGGKGAWSLAISITTEEWAIAKATNRTKEVILGAVARRMKDKEDDEAAKRARRRARRRQAEGDEEEEEEEEEQVLHAAHAA